MYLAHEELQRLLESLILRSSTDLEDDRSLLFSIQENILELLVNAKVDPQNIAFLQGVKRRLYKIADRLKDKQDLIETIPFELLNITNVLRANFRETKYYDQPWLIERMKALGYDIQYSLAGEGVCFGIVSMALQALFVNDMKTFNQRLKTIEALPLSVFHNDFEKLKEKRAECLAERHIKEADLIQSNIIDTRAFFDGIALHQSPQRYDKFIDDDSKTNTQNLEKTISLTRPVELASESLPFKVKSFVGVYSENELQTYIDCLKKNLGEHSFALTLSCDQHAILVNYNSETKRWFFMNPNDMPGVEYVHTDLLARAILNCYGHTYGLVMATNVYAEMKHSQAVSEAFLNMKQQPEWVTLHSVSAERIAQADEYEKEKAEDEPSESLLEQGIRCKNIEWLQQAMTYLYIDDKYISRLLTDSSPEVISFVFERFHPSQYSIERGLLTAIHQNQLASASILIKKLDGPTMDVLESAYSKGRIDILNMLLDKVDAGILEMVCYNLNASSHDLSLLTFLLERFTPDQSTLDFACGSRNVEAVKLILMHLEHPKLSNEQCLKLFKYKFNAAEREFVCDLFLTYVPTESQKEIFSLIQPEFQAEIAQKMRLKSNVDNVTQEYKDDLDQLKEEGKIEISQKPSASFK